MIWGVAWGGTRAEVDVGMCVMERKDAPLRSLYTHFHTMLSCATQSQATHSIQVSLSAFGLRHRSLIQWLRTA